MIGTRLEASRRFPFFALLFAAVGALLLVVGLLQKSLEFALLATLPLSWAIVIFVRRPAPIEGEVTGDALVLHEPHPQTVPYHSIQSLRMGNKTLSPEHPRLRPAPLTILHAKGALRLPKVINDSPRTVMQLYRFLWDHLQGSGSRNINGQLQEFLQEQEALFGPDMVYTFRARNRPGVPTSTGGAQSLLAVTMFLGIVWIYVAASWDLNEAFRVWGIVFLMCGGLGWLIAWAAGRTSATVKGWEQASLVISPGGLALVQGHIQGILRWEEVHDVDSHDKHRAFRISQLYGVSLRVAGAQILIADIYDRPSAVIARLIESYWRSPAPT
jgi:hypothetical protein